MHHVTAPKVTRSVDSDGHETVHGGPELKSSQSYPRGFGVAVALMYQRHFAPHFEDVSDGGITPLCLTSLLSQVPDDLWGDAGLTSIFVQLADRASVSGGWWRQ